MHDQSTERRRLRITRDALLEITVGGEFEVTLLENGLIQRRRWFAEPADAAVAIRGWQGSSADRLASHGVRSR